MRLHLWLRSVWRDLRDSTRRNDDLDAEVQATFELLRDEQIAAGLSPEQARRAALLELGGIDQLKERVRETHAGSELAHLLHDCRYAVRACRCVLCSSCITPMPSWTHRRR